MFLRTLTTCAGHSRGARKAANPSHWLWAVLGGLALSYCSGGGSMSSHVMPSPTPSPTLAPAGLGGSNYAWYRIDPPCNREPYGVVFNYDTAKATIDAQLRQMYIQGQRRLRIEIYFGRGLSTGTVMDS